ncbi:MAG: hypothetical protein ABGZ17_04465, partial [Planctomycetaceae bacterium]
MVTNPRTTSGDPRFEPNWDQRLTISVGPKSADLRGQTDRVIQAAIDYVARLGGGTVKILPDYFPKSHRSHPQFWVQDSFQVLSRPDGSRTILLPAGESFLPEVQTQLSELGFATETSQLRWEGGNIVQDFFDGESVLFVGYTIYEGVSDRAENQGKTPEDVQTILAEEFEADQVILVPYVSGNLFQRDQIGVITASGEVVVHEVVPQNARILRYTTELDNYFFRSFQENSGV